MDKIILPSGAVLEITLLPYEDAWGVSQRVSKLLESIKVDFKSIDLKNLMLSDVAVIQGPIFHVLSSAEIIDAAKTCFKRCTYNGLKIDGQTFDAKEARKDYLPVIFYVLKANIEPFFAGLISFLGTK